MINTKILTEKEFYRFAINEYKASQYESAELEDSRFIEGTYYPHICKTPCYLVYREIVRRLSEYAKVLDMGFYRPSRTDISTITLIKLFYGEI